MQQLQFTTLELYIGRCVQSILSQNYKGEIECIFVDDYTKDNSIDIIKKFWPRDLSNRTLLITRHEKNRGLSAARNTGLAHATGKYVYFLDSDDSISNDCIATLVAPLLEKQCDMVVGGYTPIDANRSYPGINVTDGPILGNDNISKAFFRGDYYMMAWNKLCNREFLLSHKLFFKEGLIHEDDLWSYCVACEAQSIYIVNKPIYQYYIRENSIATEFDIQKHLDAFAVVSTEMFKWYQNCTIQTKEKWRFVLHRFHYGLLWRVLDQSGDYKKIYKFIRSNQSLDILKYYRLGWLSTKELIREIHWLLPVSVGTVLFLIDYKLAR